MTETVTVKEVGGSTPWQHGITYWDVCFVRNGSDFHCSWGKKGDAPQVGETVEGEFTQKNGEWRFKKGSSDFKGGGGSSEATTSARTQNAGKGSWQPESERDPERSARITRQHSQEMALKWAALLDEKRLNGKPLTLPEIFRFADAFDLDVNDAGLAAIQGLGAVSATPSAGTTSGGLAPSLAPAPESQPDSDAHQFFMHLIEAAGVGPDHASKIADFITTKFTLDQRQRAESGLKDHDTQGETLARLKAFYEKAEGALPPEALDDDIPFARPEYRGLFTERERWRF